MAKYFSNKEVAELLSRVSAAYEVLGENRFKISAYDRASVSVEHLASEIKDIWDEGKLEEIPGVGKSIADHLDELFKKGKVKHFEELFSKVPPSMFEFLNIPGIGAKTAYSLAKHLKINNEKTAVAELKNAAMSGLIHNIENFGEKSEEKILKGIEILEKGGIKTKRMLLPYADELAQEVISYMKQISDVLQIDPLGSLRRMVSTIGDIDISIATNNSKKVMEHFYKFPKIKEVLGKGEELLGRVILYSGQQVDIRISKPENYGAMLQYFTGSKMHNIYLREFALKKGLSLSEYGIKKVKNHESRIKNYENEENFYKYLGLEWVPPELREGTGEIDTAVKHKLPKLVESTDIKGDLHIHSNFQIEPSHDLGESELKEILKIAEKLNYEYVGLSEHNPSYSNHSENEITELINNRNNFIEQYNYSRVNKLPIKIFKSLEIDIRPSGNLAVSDKALDLLDYGIASIHSSFDMSKEEMTKRIINGISHPKIKILGHPTGRKLNQREGYELDWDILFDFCLKNNKILEISSWPDRLDLPESLVHEAIKIGIKLVINSDSHQANQMQYLKYGVSVARRGWAEKKDIINTLSAKEIGDILK